MGSDTALMPDLKTDPYWWDAAPRRHEAVRPLSPATDVAIIGSGYTGLSAALTLARAGRDVVVIERDSVGHGASSRNFGMLGRQLKLDFTALVRRVGLERARVLYEGCNKAFAFVNGLIEREGIDCFHTQSGRYVAANTSAHLDAMEAELTARKAHFGHAFAMVGRDGQDRELVTNKFVGGAVIPEHRTVHPGLFHNGLTERVRSAGAAIHSGTEVSSIRKSGSGWQLETSRGPIAAKHLIAATNGYTGQSDAMATPAHRTDPCLHDRHRTARPRPSVARAAEPSRLS